MMEELYAYVDRKFRELEAILDLEMRSHCELDSAEKEEFNERIQACEAIADKVQDEVTRLGKAARGKLIEHRERIDETAERLAEVKEQLDAMAVCRCDETEGRR